MVFSDELLAKALKENNDEFLREIEEVETKIIKEDGYEFSEEFNENMERLIRVNKNYGGSFFLERIVRNLPNVAVIVLFTLCAGVIGFVSAKFSDSFTSVSEGLLVEDITTKNTLVAEKESTETDKEGYVDNEKVTNDEEETVTNATKQEEDLEFETTLDNSNDYITDGSSDGVIYDPNHTLAGDSDEEPEVEFVTKEEVTTKQDVTIEVEFVTTEEESVDRDNITGKYMVALISDKYEYIRKVEAEDKIVTEEYTYNFSQSFVGDSGIIIYAEAMNSEGLEFFINNEYLECLVNYMEGEDSNENCRLISADNKQVYLLESEEYILGIFEDGSLIHAIQIFGTDANEEFMVEIITGLVSRD